MKISRIRENFTPYYVLTKNQLFVRGDPSWDNSNSGLNNRKFLSIDFLQNIFSTCVFFERHQHIGWGAGPTSSPDDVWECVRWTLSYVSNLLKKRQNYSRQIRVHVSFAQFFLHSHIRVFLIHNAIKGLNCVALLFQCESTVF